MNIPKPFLLCFSLLIALVGLCSFGLTSSLAYANAYSAEVETGPAMIVARTVGTDPAVCAPTNEVRIVPGTPIYECLTVTNSGTVSLTVNTGIGSPPFMFDLEVGQTQTLTHLLPVGGQFVIVPTVSSVSTVTLSAVGANTVISDSASTHVTVIGSQTADIAFAQTVSTEEGSCATTDSINVEPNTLVYPCFILANRLSQPITVSLLSAPKLGMVPPFVYTLAANESIKLTELQGLTGTFGFTATVSTDSFATIDYNIDSSTFSSITAIARIDVAKSMLHLPIFQSQLISETPPNSQSSATCSPLPTAGTIFGFAYENIPADSTIERDGAVIETVSGNGTVSDTPGTESGTMHTYTITNGGVTIVDCGTVTVANGPEIP